MGREICCFDHAPGELGWDLRVCCSMRELVMTKGEMVVLTDIFREDPQGVEKQRWQ